MVADNNDDIMGSKAREARRRRDHDDLNNEMAGREVGRIRRFLPDDARPDEIRKKREKQAERLSQLAMALMDPTYAQLYQDTVSMVRDHAVKAESGLAATGAALSDAGQALEAITEKATKLHPGGEPVFRNEHGQAVHADGTPLSPDDAASIVWPDDAPSYEDYRAAKSAYDDAQARLDAWQDYQLYLGDLQDRLEDTDNPLTREELRETQRDVEERLPSETSVELKPDNLQGPTNQEVAVEKPRF